MNQLFILYDDNLNDLSLDLILKEIYFNTQVLKLRTKSWYGTKLNEFYTDCSTITPFIKENRLCM